MCRYIKFDTFHPAVSKGLPVTRVISRVTLQEILADAVERLAGKKVIENSANVVGFEEVQDAAGKSVVRVTLEDGRTDSGDLLIGADGIWSKVSTTACADCMIQHGCSSCLSVLVKCIRNVQS